MVQVKDVSLTGNERTFDKDDLIVSKTDLTGKITYGNRLFYQLAGLTEGQCIGTQHNVVRHPDMPRAVFDLLWSTLKKGEEIFAYVVNRSANGDHYWVFAHVTPSVDGSGTIDGYHSNRRVANKQVLNEHIVPLYSQLLEIEKSDPSPKSALEKSKAAIADILAEKKLDFNEFMFSLGT